METAQNLDECASICSFCSRMKRGRIYACARQNKYNVLALGQHLDDLSERFNFNFMSHSGDNLTVFIFEDIHIVVVRLQLFFWWYTVEPGNQILTTIKPQFISSNLKTQLGYPHPYSYSSDISRFHHGSWSSWKIDPAPIPKWAFFRGQFVHLTENMAAVSINDDVN